jgi:hypothetical protein
MARRISLAMVSIDSAMKNLWHWQAYNAADQNNTNNKNNVNNVNHINNKNNVKTMDYICNYFQKLICFLQGLGAMGEVSKTLAHACLHRPCDSGWSGARHFRHAQM